MLGVQIQEAQSIEQDAVDRSIFSDEHCIFVYVETQQGHVGIHPPTLVRIRALSNDAREQTFSREHNGNAHAFPLFVHCSSSQRSRDKPNGK